MKDDSLSKMLENRDEELDFEEFMAIIGRMGQMMQEEALQH